MKPQLSSLQSNLVLAAYALLLAPLVAGWLKLGETNVIVGILGLGMYVGEYVAFRTKLRMIRIRTELRRRALIKETGGNVAKPAVGGMVLYGVVMRMCFRIAIIVFSFMAFGLSTDGKKDLPVPMMILMLVVVLFEALSLAFVVADSGLFGVTARSERQAERDQRAYDSWMAKQLPLANSEIYYRQELLADLLLQLYTFVAYTAIWDSLNKEGVLFVMDAGKSHEPAGTVALVLLFMFTVMTLFFLVPIRLTYWLEQFAGAYTKKQRWLVRGSFVLAAIAGCVPVIAAYVRAFF